jgi:pimeloyl-ACP methyl ester carboxylesterase
MPFYEKGDVRIYYEEVGSGFPLLVIPGGGLNSTVAGLATHPFNPFDEFKGEFRVIAADLRNAKGGQSTGPLEVDRPWDAYTDDQLGLMVQHVDENGYLYVQPIGGWDMQILLGQYLTVWTAVDVERHLIPHPRVSATRSCPPSVRQSG